MIYFLIESRLSNCQSIHPYAIKKYILKEVTYISHNLPINLKYIVHNNYLH